MEILKQHYNIISSLLFVFLIIIAHFYSTHNYNWSRNTISDLGSQGYERGFMMQLGFLIFGLTLSIGILLNGLTWRTAPLFIYGLSVGLTGIFSTKPFFDVQVYSVFQDSLHSLFAKIAGVTFSIGILIQMFYTDNHAIKWIHFMFFILILALSASFGLLKNQQGIVQRILYLVSIIWLIKFYKP
ncbi:MAG: DUF998 domain-containing protein [Saprospiraceae bacterium]|nr:DUF998 domain-containing protein [Saprospiraceae bacterium]